VKTRKRTTGHKPTPATGEIILYRTEDGDTRIECRFAEGTIWLTQALIAELFQTTVPNVNLHLKNIYEQAELSAQATIKDFLIVRQEGERKVSRTVFHYNLHAILAVGYRVQSPRGTQFRQWATARLEEYLRKGFVLDDDRLKNPPGPGVPDYFDEMLERIRDIRASERRMYLRVREMNPHLNTIANRLSLRPPQRDSLEILARLCDIVPLEKNTDIEQTLKAVQTEYTTVKDFERDFPSLCFALATGVGKTRLMGAFIAYLYKAEGIRHYFVLAPNLTIYNKLITDFTPNTPKYVFQGIADFAVEPPLIITGDNYETGFGEVGIGRPIRVTQLKERV
jgi:hypothetical protein